LKYYVGCSSWKHQTWTKDFFPAALEPEKYLAYYFNIFDFAEVDLSTNSSNISFYGRLLNKFTFRKWAKNSHNNFRFTLKLPAEIINNNNNDNIGLGNFLEEFVPLKEKVLAVVIEQPRALTLKDGREWLDEILDICNYHGYSVALEFNHFSWYQDLTYHILKKHNAALIWSDNRYPYHPVVTADFLYLRITENEKKWIEKIKEKEKEREKEADNLDSVIVAVNGPTKANTVLKILNLPVRKYGYNNKWIGKLIMCVDLNAFFPSCEELRDPMIVGKPHAVIMTEQKENITKGAVASCSYEARNFGVRSAMSVSKAKELCPNLILRPVDIPYYRQISEKVMNILEEYADVLEQSSIDEAYLDCTNKMMEIMITETATTTIEQYASTIKKAIKERCGLLASVGVASTKSAAKIASDFQKPDGLTVIYSDQLQKFFERLEVERISGIGPKTQQVLKEMGTETIGQLAKHDVQKLIEKFGKKNGIWMWRVANGRDYEPVRPREDHVSLSTEQTLESFTGNKETILKSLNKLIDEIYERIRRQRYEFKTVGVKLVRSDFSIETREISFSNFQNKRESIASVIEGLLDRFSFVGSTSSPSSTITRTLPTVRKVGIKVSNLVRIEKKKSLTQKTLLDYFDSI
jgi:DNA polymerase IV (DinB-like DNA polymerase)